MLACAAVHRDVTLAPTSRCVVGKKDPRVDTTGTRRMTIAVTLTAIVVIAARAQTPPSYDLILRHGTIVDGSGLPRYQADVAVAGGSIARIGNLTGARAAVDLDVTGLFVTP